MPEGQALNDGRVLEVVAAENNSLKRHLSVDRLLHCQRHECLDFGDLRRLLHHDVVIVTAWTRDIAWSKRSVCRRHGDDASLIGEQVIVLVSLATKNLKGNNILQLRKDLRNVPITAIRNLQDLGLGCLWWEQGLRGIRKIPVERKALQDIRHS